MAEKICVASDYPPIRDGGTATYSVAWSLAKALEPSCGLLLTRRLHPGALPVQIGAGIEAEKLLFRDAYRLGLRGFSEDLRALIDCFLLLVQLPWVVAKIHRGDCRRVFMIGTNHWSCIVFALMLGRAAGLPADLFLMDDLEASARMQGKPYKARLARVAEQLLLPRLRQVWTISRGYAEHLESKYGVAAAYLPLVIRQSSAVYRPYAPESGERVIGYSGGIHGLYAEPLKELVAEIRRRNQAGEGRYRLRIFTVGAPPGFLDFLGGNDAIDVVVGLDNPGLVDGLGRCYANFLPYSHAEEFRLMVTTAFSCKSSEYLACGRPILIYGPDYATVPRHFAEAGLPLVETGKGRISELLDRIDAVDGQGLIESYNQLVRRFHAPAAVRSLLQAHWTAAASDGHPADAAEPISHS